VELKKKVLIKLEKVFPKNIIGKSLCRVIINKKIYFWITLAIRTNQRWKGGNPNFIMKLRVSSAGAYKILKILKRKKYLWIIR